MSYLTDRHPVIIPAEVSQQAHKMAVGAGTTDWRD